MLYGVAFMMLGALFGFYLFFDSLFFAGSVIQAIFSFMIVALINIFGGVAIIVRSRGGLHAAGLIAPRETRAVEKTYVYGPPSFCSTCGADLNPQNVDWAGPLTVKCPYCGASHDAIKREV
jgi:DNA-directed RNA polymerase subunit RPC12/RpoP